MTTITVQLGQVFAVKLQENPTTGYQWQLGVTDGLQIISSRYVPPNSGLIGSGGTHVWKIRAIEEGPQVVYGVYKRPQEDYTGSEQHYYKHVNVVDLDDNY